MRCGFLICSRFICQICGPFSRVPEELAGNRQSVSPFWTVYSTGASACRTVIEAAAVLVACADAKPGTKLAEATTNAIMSFRIAALSFGYGRRTHILKKGYDLFFK